MAELNYVVIVPLPTTDNAVTYGTARLEFEDGQALRGKTVTEIPGTRFAPPRRISL